jgi:uncharacterized protein (DUF885 family)
VTQFDRRSFLASAAGAGLCAALPAYAAPGSEDAKLQALFDRMFDEALNDSPERATGLGYDKGERALLKSRLSDGSETGRLKRLAAAKGRVSALRAIDRAKLSPERQLNLDVILYQEEEAVRSGERYSFGYMDGGGAPYVVSQLEGAYRLADFLDSQHSVADAADAEAYLKRLSAYAVAMDQDLERQRLAEAKGVVPPDFICDLTLGQLRALRGKPAEQTILVTSLAEKARKANLAGDWAGRATAIVSKDIFPAYDRQIAAMQALRAKARPDVGAWALPDGGAYYADALKSSTSIDFTPEQVHQLGLDQVRDISREIDVILKAQGLSSGSVGARLAAFNVDPKQLFADSDSGRAELLAYLNGRMQAVAEKLPQAFGKLPKAKVEARRVPEFIQDGAANGYYQSGTLDGSRPSAFYINLKDVRDWPRNGLATLAYHETNPGHHLQVMLALENPDIPLYQRSFSGFTAYIEGWALYAEQLADELGLYQGDPEGRLGYLQSFLFRAARLVVDTGIHAKRWTRAQATQYFVDSCGFPAPRAQREVERYFNWPGQACSYKVGHTVWVEVREAAKRRLGSSFELKAFHDAMLAPGSMPLAVLRRHAAAWRT